MTVDSRLGRIASRGARRLRAIRIPIGLIAISGCGLALWTAVPRIGPFIALRSAHVIAPFDVVDVPHIAVQLAGYWAIAGSLRSWSDISWAVFLMSFVIADRLTDRLYAAAFVVGSAVGGVTFMLTGPNAVLIGPTMAAYGLVGFYCVTALRWWRSLHWLGRLYSVLVFAMAVFTVATAFTEPPGTRVAEAAALVAALAFATRIVPRPLSEAAAPSVIEAAS